MEEVVEVVQEDRAEKAEKDEKAQAEEAADAKECTIEEKLNDDIDWSNYIDEYNSRVAPTSKARTRTRPDSRPSWPTRSP